MNIKYQTLVKYYGCCELWIVFTVCGVVCAETPRMEFVAFIYVSRRAEEESRARLHCIFYCDYFCVVVAVTQVTRVFLHLAAVKINSKSQERRQARARCSGRWCHHHTSNCCPDSTNMNQDNSQ